MGRNKHDTSCKILAAAAELFSGSAYASVSVDEVAEKAGCTKVTVYQHFQSKDELVMESLRMRLGRREEQLDAFLAGTRSGTDPILAVFDWLEQWLDPVHFHGCAFIKAVNELSGVLPQVREIAAEAKEKIAQRFAALAKASGRARPRELGQELALIFEGAQSLALIQSSTRPAKLARRIANTLLSTRDRNDAFAANHQP
jgi:AcrR family transcriptional regulator